MNLKIMSPSPMRLNDTRIDCVSTSKLAPFVRSYKSYLNLSNEEICNALSFCSKDVLSFLCHTNNEFELPDHLLHGKEIKLALILESQAGPVSIDDIIRDYCRSNSYLSLEMLTAYIHELLQGFINPQSIEKNVFNITRIILIIKSAITALNCAISDFVRFFSSEFHENISPENIGAVKPVGDLHENGCATIEIEVYGKRFFIKNKPISTTNALSKLIDEIGFNHLKIPKTWREGEHIIEQEVLGSRSVNLLELQGALIELESFSFSINLTDLSVENFIYREGKFILIDYETAYRPIWASFPDHYLQSSTLTGSLLTPRFFNKNSTTSDENKITPNDPVCGVSKFEALETLERSHRQAIRARIRKILPIVHSLSTKDNSYYRILIEDTAFYEKNRIQFFEGLGASSYLGAILNWISLFSQYHKMSKFFGEKHTAYFLSSSMLGYVPTFSHSPQTTTIIGGDFEKGYPIANSHLSGSDSVESRWKNFEKNWPLNSNILEQQYVKSNNDT